MAQSQRVSDKRPVDLADTEGGEDGRRWLRGRKLGAAALQRALLALLARQASHGYELIQALDTLSNGYYRPSPGVVYPALARLETDGLATAAREGNRKRYALTEAGRAQLVAQQAQVDALFQGLRHASRKMTWLRQAWAGEPRVLGPDGADLATGWVPAYVEARVALREALMSCSDASPAVQRRLAVVFQSAAEAIQREIGPAAPPVEPEDPES